jgi:tRNA (guanine-N7-)-methyltransferase
MFPDVNFIGVDIKGARMWTGATQALNEGLKNVAFLRTNIEVIDRFFSQGEVSEIWLTFSDPQMKNPRKRLTSTWFLNRYRHFLADGGFIHLKTDSNFLATYTKYMVEKNGLPMRQCTFDLYAEKNVDPSLTDIRTYYEGMWLERGIPIKYLQFELPRQNTLEEPDIEIPVDGYRSYNHQVVSTKKTGK